MSDFGTPELKRHCRLKLQPRDLSNSGNVITVGYTNEVPDLLERLYVQGFLKALWERQIDAERRRDNGRSLQALYMLFSTKGKESAMAGTENRAQITLEGEIGSVEDVAWTVFNKTMTLLGPYAGIARGVCIEGQVCGLKETKLRKSLDEIPRAMEMAEKMVRESLDNAGL